MKLIFILDFLIEHNQENLLSVIEKKWDFLIENRLLMHISQIFEAGLKSFEDIGEKEKFIPNKMYGRLSEEWVLWLYSNNEDLAFLENFDSTKKENFTDIINCINQIKSNRNFYKPFNYPKI